MLEEGGGLKERRSAGFGHFHHALFYLISVPLRKAAKKRACVCVFLISCARSRPVRQFPVFYCTWRGWCCSFPRRRRRVYVACVLVQVPVVVFFIKISSLGINHHALVFLTGPERRGHYIPVIGSVLVFKKKKKKRRREKEEGEEEERGRKSAFLSDYMIFI